MNVTAVEIGEEEEFKWVDIMLDTREGVKGEVEGGGRRVKLPSPFAFSLHPLLNSVLLKVLWGGRRLRRLLRVERWVGEEGERRRERAR